MIEIPLALFVLICIALLIIEPCGLIVLIFLIINLFIPMIDIKDIPANSSHGEMIQIVSIKSK